MSRQQSSTINDFYRRDFGYFMFTNIYFFYRDLTPQVSFSSFQFALFATRLKSLREY